MTGLYVGLDLGGTKSAIRAETADGAVVVDASTLRPDWEAEPAEAAARWIAGLLDAHLPAGTRVAGLGVGAQGLNTPAASSALAAALAARGLPARCINDAALLVPAAGLNAGLGLIAGTGAIVVGTDAHGDPVAVGGWGSVIGDDAGAAGIVREATRLALWAHDDGLRDDGLLSALLVAFGVPTPERLARTVNDIPTAEHWAPRAPAVFAAASAGSSSAQRAVEHAVGHLAALVGQALRRGAVGEDVVCAGGVIVHQPAMFGAVAAAVRAEHPQMRVRLLTDPPVVGALRLARRAGHESNAPQSGMGVPLPT